MKKINTDIQTTFTNEGNITYKRGKEINILPSLFKRSNKGFRKLYKDSWYGSKYHFFSPSDWKDNNLAITTNVVFVNHIKNLISVLIHNLQAEHNDKITSKYTKLTTHTEASDRKTKKTKRTHNSYK